MNLHSNARTTPKSRFELVLRSATCSAEQVAADFAVSSRTVRKWRRRFAAAGRDGLVDRSSRPHRNAWRTDEPRSELIRRLRLCRLTGPQIAGALKMPRSTVAAVLKRSGMRRLRDLEPPKPVIRYERSVAGRADPCRHQETGAHPRSRPPHHRRSAGWNSRRGMGVCPRRNRRCVSSGLRRSAPRRAPGYRRWLPVPRARLLSSPRLDRASADERQRQRLPLTPLRRCLPALPDPSLANSALHAQDKRQSRAAHPDPNAGVGLRHLIRLLARTNGGLAPMARVLQSPPAPRRARWHYSLLAPPSSEVNNVAGIHI